MRALVIRQSILDYSDNKMKDSSKANAKKLTLFI